MAFPAAQNAVVGAVPPEAIGKATGTNTTLRELGGVFGIAISVAVFAAAGSYASPADFTDGFVAAMGVSAALSLLAACAGALLPPAGGSARRPRSARSPESPRKGLHVALQVSTIRPGREWTAPRPSVITSTSPHLQRSAGNRRHCVECGLRPAPAPGPTRRRNSYIGSRPASMRRTGGRLDVCPSWDIRRGVATFPPVGLITNSAKGVAAPGRREGTGYRGLRRASSTAATNDLLRVGRHLALDLFNGTCGNS